MKINTQPIQKQDLTHPLLSINSIFYTIQGEGPYAGRPAVFVRLAGCNLQCPFCDTQYNHNAHMHPETVVATVQSTLEEAGLKKANPLVQAKPLVVITGGEPFRQNLVPLVKLLSTYGYLTQIETNGTLFQHGLVDIPYLTIVCSPKTGAINPKLIPHLDAIKYIIHADKVDPDDGLPLKSLEHTNGGKVARMPEYSFRRPNIYVQPADEQDPEINQRNLEAAINSAMTYGYTLCIQTHKIIGME